jgi:hypothetical protein
MNKINDGSIGKANLKPIGSQFRASDGRGFSARERATLYAYSAPLGDRALLPFES